MAAPDKVMLNREAPLEMNTYVPQFRAFWAAENVTATVHTIDTLRGAAVRNAINGSQQIDVALHRFGGDRTVIGKLRNLMVTFTPDFAILPGTAPTQRQVPPGRSLVLPDGDSLIHRS